jgi:hypothetical protein
VSHRFFYSDAVRWVWVAFELDFNVKTNALVRNQTEMLVLRLKVVNSKIAKSKLALALQTFKYPD